VLGYLQNHDSTFWTLIVLWESCMQTQLIETLRFIQRSWTSFPVEIEFWDKRHRVNKVYLT
jgi:hypothetical protein